MRDDGVDADCVLVPEGLPDGVDGREPDVRRVERVDPAVGGAARVGRAAEVADRFDDAAVVGDADDRLPVLGACRRVDHHGQVHVVKVSQPQELGLAFQEFELPQPRLVDPPLDIAVLLGGDGEEDDAPGQGPHRLRLDEPHGRSEQAGDLRVVAAGVGRARCRIGEGMVAHDQPVELTQEPQRGPVC